MPRKQRTEDELSNASDHLYYEISMLTRLAEAMALGYFGEGLINNAVLESFTIHARAILDFLYDDSPQVDDVVAQDYFLASVNWQNTRPAKSAILDRVHKRVAKEVAHLTYARQDVTPEIKGWPFLQIADEINIAFDKFLDIVPLHLLGGRWDEFKREKTGKNRSA